MASGQLYSVLKGVEVVGAATWDPTENRFVASEIKSFPAMVFITWPNGFPCIEVELYLAYLSDSLRINSSGGSLKEVAAMLSHLIRYCWSCNLNLWELGEEHFYSFVCSLVEEPHARRIGEKARKRNRVREIISRCVAFFFWLQENVITRVIVGPREASPQIRLVWEQYTDRNGKRRWALVYPLRPEKNTRDPKGVMATAIRDRLWQVVADWSLPENQTPQYRRRFRSEQDFKDELAFLKARRELLLKLQEHTGARPGELVRMKVSENENAVFNEKLCIPTEKKEDPDDKRSIWVTFEVALQVEAFINTYRLHRIIKASGGGRQPLSDDCIFLNVDGTSMSAATLEREFSRIAKRARIESRACLSMFRHRFITLLVAAELKGLMKVHPGFSQATMTLGDQRSVLARVQAFTGHKDLTSALEYIDYGWDELGAIDNVKAVLRLGYLISDCLPELISMTAEIQGCSSKQLKQMMPKIVEWFVRLNARTQQMIAEAHLTKEYGKEILI